MHSPMILYGIKNCDTVKKARTALTDAGVDYRFHDFRAEGIDAATIQGWIDELGLDRVLNKRGTTWRKLSDDEKAETDPATLIALMAAQPTLIKRPVIEADGQVLVGFKADVQDALAAKIGS